MTDIREQEMQGKIDELTAQKASLWAENKQLRKQVESEGALRVVRKQYRQTAAQIAAGNGHELSPVEPWRADLLPQRRALWHFQQHRGKQHPTFHRWAEKLAFQ